MIGVTTCKVTVTECTVTDGDKEWIIPLAEPLPAYITAIINQFGEPHSSRLFWHEHEAERAKAEAKETLRQGGYLRRIGPVGPPPPE